MLHLQRASAGSGKTFALAKTFIRLLISIQNENGRRRLRSDAELADSLSHILAVTFTNKATKEMQQRIVEKLAALANGVEPELMKDIDYMADFMSEFSATQDQINHVCQKALKHLIVDYSDFNVSTIDSFFQSILRTFAYEAELNDTYNLEIDNKYVAGVGLDSVLDSVVTADADPEIMEWIRLLMEEEGSVSQRNIFQRSTSSNSTYNEFLSNAEKLDKESFKEIRVDIEEYFASLDKQKITLIDVMNKWDEALKQRKSHELETAIHYAGELEAKAEEFGMTLSNLMTDANVRIINNILAGVPEKRRKTKSNASPFSFCSESIYKKLIKKLSTEQMSEFDKLYCVTRDALDGYMEFEDSGAGKLWKLYKSRFPVLALLHRTQQKMMEYLESSNTLQLSDTNTLLRRIIAEDDTPFIYERIGTRINHFLIDEFQDTSKMQWENFEPLLKESLSRNNSNLIIGDAKQSIYRFRNADPSLISDVVPRSYRTLPSADDTPADKVDVVKLNTNWRSDLKVIEFNNYFFAALSECFTRNIARLYDNCIQPPSPGAVEKNRGYISVTVTPYSKKNPENDETLDCPELVPLVKNLIDRGYRRRDICILVRTHVQGDKVVSNLIEYNASEEGHRNPIVFISDESLKIGSATSVRIVLSGLQMLSRGDFHSKEAEEKNVQQPLQEAITEEGLSEMMKRLPTLALPMLVEALAEEFVPEEIKNTESPFMAAFLDAVIDYTDRMTPDIASFLDWWSRKGANMAITSPEDTDAIRIMTVHKSKGLEYKCVIIPNADFEFGPYGKTEWVWTQPDTALLKSNVKAAGVDPNSLPPLPALLPLETRKNSLMDTPHFQIWREYQERVCQDGLNSAYVAFTRAVNELYVFVSRPYCDIKNAPVEDLETGNPQEENGSIKMAFYLDELLSKSTDYLAKLRADGRRYLPATAISIKLEDSTDIEEEVFDSEKIKDLTKKKVIYSYGSPLTEKEIAGIYTLPEEDEAVLCDFERRRKEILVSKRQAEERLRLPDIEIDRYDVSKMPDNLHARESEFEIDDEDLDPRSEGNLLHSVMEYIKVPSDLDSGLLRLMVRGLISSETAADWRKMLEVAIAHANKEFGWFSKDLKILNERRLLSRNGKLLRPDRIMVTPTGEAVVVDFKFGNKADVPEYENQVRGYIQALTQTGRFTGVKGYLWYVKLNEIKEI